MDLFSLFIKDLKIFKIQIRVNSFSEVKKILEKANKSANKIQNCIKNFKSYPEKKDLNLKRIQIIENSHLEIDKILEQANNSINEINNLDNLQTIMLKKVCKLKSLKFVDFEDFDDKYFLEFWKKKKFTKEQLDMDKTMLLLKKEKETKTTETADFLKDNEKMIRKKVKEF